MMIYHGQQRRENIESIPQRSEQGAPCRRAIGSGGRISSMFLTRRNAGQVGRPACFFLKKTYWLKGLPRMEQKTLDGQQQQWQDSFREMPEMFGSEASKPAIKAAEFFEKEGKTKILELGCGQGRDTIYFARRGFMVYALDYSTQGLEAINERAQELGLSHLIVAKVHDVRTPLPFADETFDACFSHMLFCMALTTSELEFLSNEIRRVLKPAGLNFYTVRNTTDAHYRTGIHRGEDLWEIGGGFIVHFFSRGKVEHLAKGYEIVSIEEFDEGEILKKLYAVTLRKIP
jgi:SAM-dependent methyltransferase